MLRSADVSRAILFVRVVGTFGYAIAPLSAFVTPVSGRAEDFAATVTTPSLVHCVWTVSLTVAALSQRIVALSQRAERITEHVMDGTAESAVYLVTEVDAVGDAVTFLGLGKAAVAAAAAEHVTWTAVATLFV